MSVSVVNVASLPLQVFRGFQHNGLGMIEAASVQLDRNILQFVLNFGDLDPSKPTMFPIATSGLWNCAPRGDRPGLVFELLANGAADYLYDPNVYVCLDGAGEGFPLDDTILAHMEEQLARFNLSTDRVVYLTSDLRAKERYRHWAAAKGRKESFTPVSLDVQFYYLSGIYRKQPRLVEDILARALLRLEDTRRLKKKFLSFNYTPRPHRYALALYFYSSGLLEDGLVSFQGPGVDNGPGDGGWEDPAHVAQWLRDLGATDADLADLPGLTQLCPIELEKRDRYSLAYDIGEVDLYFDTYFSIVTESVFQDRQSELRFTEKIYKPMANAHPFLLLGNPGSLRMLRQRGFKTFAPLIDESYDDIDSPRERLQVIKTEIARLCTLPHAELANLYRDLWPAILHNFCVFHMGAGPFLERDPGILELANRPIRPR